MIEVNEHFISEKSIYEYIPKLTEKYPLLNKKEKKAHHVNPIDFEPFEKFNPVNPLKPSV